MKTVYFLISHFRGHSKYEDCIWKWVALIYYLKVSAVILLEYIFYLIFSLYISKAMFYKVTKVGVTIITVASTVLNLSILMCQIKLYNIEIILGKIC